MKTTSKYYTLKPKRTYKAIFNFVSDQIRKTVRPDLRIEHVGGTALKSPMGKGDVDIYVVYDDKKDMKNLQKILTNLFGKPVKIHEKRIRFNFYKDGVEVELQLASKEETDIAAGLRDYLVKYPRQAEIYAHGVAKIRENFRESMSDFKKKFAQKAA
jgi:GrpB-like predicted nucleotidyltransferase (UPF0157 family)